jgi:hypothetical protein
MSLFGKYLLKPTGHERWRNAIQRDRYQPFDSFWLRRNRWQIVGPFFSASHKIALKTLPIVLIMILQLSQENKGECASTRLIDTRRHRSLRQRTSPARFGGCSGSDRERSSPSNDNGTNKKAPPLGKGRLKLVTPTHVRSLYLGQAVVNGYE